MAEETQVLVKFVTKLPAELRVPETPVAVPTKLKRYGLSQIINHLLALDPPRPFDFLVDGELVRKSLEQHLLDHNLSAESLLVVEYVPAIVPPKEKQSVPHDDWVSCVDGAWQDTAVSGSYDGQVRLWDANLECLGSFRAHALGVNALRCLSGAAASTSAPSSSSPRLLLTAGKDHMLRLWQLQGGAQGQGFEASVVASYAGHSDAVEDVALSPDGRRCCSVGWDGAVHVWRTGQEVLDDAAAAGTSTTAASAKKASAKKRRKGAAADAEGSEGSALPEGGIREESLAQLEGHKHCVAGVAWPSEQVVFTGGWDHSVRMWNVETGANVDSYHGSKAVYAVASSSQQPHLVLFGGSDKAPRLWDTRSKQGDALGVKTLAPHGGWVSSVAWSGESPYHVATGSYDGCVRLWDVRTPVPLGTQAAHREAGSGGDGKVLCVAWWGSGADAGGLQQQQQVLSGGSDNTLRVFELGAGSVTPSVAA